jgi:hypothetical protein
MNYYYYYLLILDLLRSYNFYTGSTILIFGKTLWYSGRVMRKSKEPGFAPQPGKP